MVSGLARCDLGAVPTTGRLFFAMQRFCERTPTDRLLTSKLTKSAHG